MTEDTASFLLTNKQGGYTLFSHQPKSRYEGVFFKHQRLYKVVESFLFVSSIQQVTNMLWAVQREREDVTEFFFMPAGKDALVYELSKPAEFILTLDCKITDDNRIWGRNYELSHERGCVVVQFTKKNDDRDDNSQSSDEYELYLAVYAPELEYLPLGEWHERQYTADKKRNSPPNARWVYYACKLKGKAFVFGMSTNKEDAISLAKDVYDDKEDLKREREVSIVKLIGKKKYKDQEQDLAYKCAVNALDALTIDEKGIYAGLPWFYQYWARDELISLKAPMLLGNYALAKKILFKYLEQVNEKSPSPGKFHTFQDNAALAAADSFGWLFKRIDDFMTILKKQKKLDQYLSKREVQTIEDKLRIALDQVQNHCVKDGLVINHSKETWMDTTWKDDDRTGACIEIQALTLAMLKFHKKLTGKKHAWEAALKKNTRAAFWNKTYLVDVAGTKTIRPNVFIAAYVYPDLLTEAEWKTCFDTVLPKLWLAWGGLASLQKNHKLYTDTYTGATNQSYHRGDSWFWVNNLAAIVLSTLGPKKFQKYVDKILKASTKELLYLGASGHHAEVSSAKQLEAQGCLSQAWSNALYIELLHAV